MSCGEYQEIKVVESVEVVAFPDEDEGSALIPLFEVCEIES